MFLRLEADDLGSDVLERAQHFAHALGDQLGIRAGKLRIELAGLQAVRGGSDALSRSIGKAIATESGPARRTMPMPPSVVKAV